MYIIDINKIEPGDIILTRDDSPLSQFIRRLSKSNFSHARLHVGAFSCIESDGRGVQAQNMQRVLFENRDDVKLLRLASDNKNLIANAIAFARQKVGTQYSTDEAKLSLLKSKEKAKEPNRQFCTRFVSQSFLSAGVNLVDNPDYCNPEELLKSDKLIEVSDFLREATDNEVAFAESESPIEKQNKIHNKILEKAREIASDDIQTFEQLAQYVIKHPENEPLITQIVEESGFLTMWEWDIEENPYHYDFDEFISHFENPFQRLEVAMYFATTEKHTRERFEQTLNTVRFCYSISGLRYFEVLIELYEKLIELSHKREAVALETLTK